MEIVTRKEAREQGLKYYFTGKPCKRNHITHRLTANRSCVECVLQHVKNNPESKKHSAKKYYAKNKETLNKKTKEWRQNNPEKHRATERKYAENNRDKKREWAKKFRSSDKGKALRCFHENKRRAAKLQRTPQWSDLDKIKEIYMTCPKDHEVDHICPLQGKLVSGLHVPENLRHLHKDIHKHKNNKFTPVSILRDDTVDPNLL